MQTAGSCCLPLKYESLGRSVIPMGKAKNPKRPLVPWEEYQRRQPDPDEILTWLEVLSPTNWAMVCGRVSGVVVLDCDSKAAAEWARTAGLKPAVATPHGLHFYFSCGGSTVATTALEIEGTTFEIKGENSLANFCGRGYTLHERALVPDALYPLDVLDSDLLRKIRGDSPHRREKLPALLPRGERNADLFSLARTMYWRGAHPDAIRAALRAQNSYCDPPLAHDELDRIVLSAGKYQVGFTVPIEVNRALTRLNLTPYQSRVLQAILLLCHGLVDRYNWISISLLSQVTGIQKPHVSDAVRGLQAIGLISRRGSLSHIEICVNSPERWQTRRSAPVRVLPEPVTISTKGIPESLPSIRSNPEPEPARCA